MKPQDAAMLEPLLREPFIEFKKCMLCNDDGNKAMYDLITSFYTPGHGGKYGHNDEVECNMYNPSPENSLERALSGVLSYHLSPTEEFFGLHPLRHLRVKKKKKAPLVDVIKALTERTKHIHSIIQDPENFSIMGQASREKLKIGLAAKTVDPDPLMVAKLQYYPYDMLGVGTSDGKSTDIHLVCEELNEFNARRRFPEPFGQPDYWKERSMAGVFAAEKRKYYRLNVPVPVLRQHLDDHLRRSILEEKERMKMIRALLPRDKTENMYPGASAWADVWFTIDRVMSVEIKDYRPIMVNKASPPFKVMHFARGQAEKSLPLLMALSHGLEKTVKAFERTFDPAWAMTDDNQRLALDLSPDGINFIEAGTQEPKPLSLGADLRAPIEYSQYLQMMLDRVFYLDVFELLNKSRMTKAEVQSRDTDDYRKLTAFVVQDQADDLNPLVLSINYLIHQEIGKDDPLGEEVLKATYTSEIAFANKNSMFNKIMRMANMIGGFAEVLAEDNPMLDVADLPNYFSSVMMKAGETGVLRNEADRLTREKLRLGRQRIADDTAAANALGASTQALGAVPGATEGGGQGSVPDAGTGVP